MVRRGEGRVMFSSRANRTAAIIEAAMVRVEAKRSRVRRSSSNAFARRISPMQSSIGEQKTKCILVCVNRRIAVLFAVYPFNI